ncbi:hypothetical protein [Pelotalea chapellei]|uniref:Uncharacterized protein n=1 Tax=Pelotalea chapellei TaxID=44671 RepID=A0ABS5U4S4_9BACT|nr:hypothetical protein [Pelotalea chapellei]MBT1070671.1 hypothetical protein [Pelotalea chapellei]
MPRTAAETANILSNLYDENFANGSFEPFRISWPQLRSISAVTRLDDYFLKNIARELSGNERTLIPFDDFLLVVAEDDLSHYRKVPGRLLEQYLPDIQKAFLQNEDVPADEVEDE